MRKSRLIRIWAMILAMSIVLSLAGCGTNTTPTTTGDNTASSEQSITTPESTSDTSEGETSEPTTVPVETIIPTAPPAEATEPTEPPVTIPPEEQKDEFGLKQISIMILDIEIITD